MARHELAVESQEVVLVEPRPADLGTHATVHFITAVKSTNLHLSLFVGRKADGFDDLGFGHGDALSCMRSFRHFFPG